MYSQSQHYLMSQRCSFPSGSSAQSGHSIGRACLRRVRFNFESEEARSCSSRQSGGQVRTARIFRLGERATDNVWSQMESVRQLIRQFFFPYQLTPLAGVLQTRVGLPEANIARWPTSSITFRCECQLMRKFTPTFDNRRRANVCLQTEPRRRSDV